jgi:hypothetical protein
VDYIEQSAALEQATPIIEQYLFNAKKKELVDSQVKALRAAAKIEYLGPFAPGAEQTAQPAQGIPSPANPGGAQTAGTAPGTADKPTEQAKQENEKDYISRGLTGAKN